MAVVEAKNPRCTIPKAMRNAYIRILLSYIGGVFVISLLVPFLMTSHRSSSSHLSVIGCDRRYPPHCFASHSAKLQMDSFPRDLHAHIPSGLPYVSVVLSSAIALLSCMVFNDLAWFAHMTTTAELLPWLCVGMTYLGFHKGLEAQGIDQSTLLCRLRFQPYAPWWVVGASTVPLLFNGWGR
ncbi:hypothetical protein BS17DRAFT_476734 [Gyrodon lividus]|nr:hypothetical protein BS17DRAFT_476734 [Gyrodon lividus]